MGFQAVTCCVTARCVMLAKSPACSWLAPRAAGCLVVGTRRPCSQERPGHRSSQFKFLASGILPAVAATVRACATFALVDIRCF